VIRYRCVLILCYFISVIAYAQDERPLRDVLELLEKRHDMRFSYADDDIKGLSIIVPSSDLSFRESLNILKKRLPLSFTFINDRQIAISARSITYTVCGYIVDALGNPLENVSIMGGKTGTITDASGYFSMDVSSRIELLNIRSIGYEQQQFDVENLMNIPCKRIALRKIYTPLSEVIISSYLTRGIEIQEDGGIGINFKNFSLLPGVIESDVLLSTQALPGVQSINETVSDLNIRGGTQDQNLIIWDGIKMYQSGHFFGLISAFNPSHNDQATVYTNATPAHYGDGVSGTIVLASSNEINTDINAGIDVNLINTGGYVNVPVGSHSSLKISARKSLSDLIVTPTYEQYFDRAFQNSELTSSTGNTDIEDDIFSFQDANLKWIYKVTDRDHIQINGLYVSNELIFQERAIINNEEESRQSSASQNNFAGGVLYTRTWNERLTTKLHFTGSNYTLDAVNFDLVNNQRLFQENDVLETTARLEAELLLKNNNPLTTGYQFIETGVSNLQDINIPRFRRLIKDVIRTHALYGTYRTASKNNTTRLTLGTRINYYDLLSEFTIEPRLLLEQDLFPNWTATLSSELKSQPTSQVVDVQTDFLGIENRRWIVADGNEVPLLESRQIALGLRYFKKGWLFNAEGYFKEVDGLTTRSQGFQNQLQFVPGIGSYEVTGLDILLRKQWKKWNARIGYSFAINDYEFDNLPDTIESIFPNNLDIRHIVKGALTYDYNNIKAGVSVFYRSGRPTTDLLNDEVTNDALNFAAPNDDQLSDYLRIDFSASYRWQWHPKVSTEFGISLWNITNTENEINRSFFVDNNMPETVIEEGLGFTPNAVLRFIFK